jgi:type VI secretion system protein ImpL
MNNKLVTRHGRKLLHPMVLATLGVVALIALVWFVGPLLAIGASRPLESVLSRSLAIALIVLALVARFVWRAVKRRRANAALLQGVAAGPSASDKELATLQERFTQAIDTLQSSRKASRWSRGRTVYELPWYLFIGAPGSGKTTALMNAGLTFPLAEKMGQASVKGVGGTRNCDWWFTSDAVLIDTAGRYTLQESDAQVDATAWDGFLALLKKTRPRRPINGVLLTVNIQDLLQQGAADREQHAAKLRARLQELHDKLGIRAPVYVLVTKADLIGGFNESFGDLPKEDRDQVWGFSFPYDAKADVRADPLAAFDREYALLEQSLQNRLLDRMQAAREPLQRASIFAFPQEFAALRPVLAGFLGQVFSHGGSLESASLLRGVYFTSGTQEGTPIDRVMGALSRSFGVDARIGNTAAQGKSFFLHRLLRDLVFAEQGLVGADTAFERRRGQWRLAGYGVLGLLGVAMLAGWALSYSRNRSYTDEVAGRLPEVQRAVDSLPPATSGDVAPLASVLTAVREIAAPPSFPVDQAPLSYGLGLYQGDKLDAGAQMGYYRLLDRTLMPRVARRLEEQLRSADRNNLEYAYEALKSYLMLYTPDKFDASALKAWISIDWDNNLRNALTADQRASLDGHLDAMLQRGAPTAAQPMDKALVASVREMLVAYPLEFRAYSRLKRLYGSNAAPDFSVARAAGPQAPSVFERASGEPITRGIPGFYTKDGYQKVFQSNVERGSVALAREEQWVLGTEGTSAKTLLKDSIAGGELTNRVRRLYLEDYIKAWDKYLADVRLIKLDGLQGSLSVARLISGVDSPLAAYLRAVARETTLVEAKPSSKGRDSLNAGLDLTVGQGITKESIKSLAEAQQRPNDAPGGPIEKMVDDHFASIHRLVEGSPPPLDETLKLFNEVYVQLSAVDAAQKSKTAPPPAAGGAALKAAAGQQPEPVRAILETLADAGANQSRNAERQSLSSDLKPITDFCARAIAGRYPFAAGSRADVLPEDFGQMFGAGGMLDDFYQRKLAPLVDTGTSPWSFKPSTDGTRPAPTAALADFERAARIREVFFRSGGKAPSFRLDMKAVDLAGLTEVSLDIDGQVTKFTAGNTTPVTIAWPSARVASQIRLAATPSTSPGLSFDGPWALFRMFDRAEIVPSAQPERFAVLVNLDGHKVRFEVTSSSVFNPFRLRDIQQFRCPAAL